MIFEAVSPATAKKRKTKEDWVKIGVDYLEHRSKGWTRTQYCKEAEISVSTFEKAMRRFKPEIEAAFKEESKKPKKTKSTGNRKKDLINQFREQLRTRSKDTNAANNNKSVNWFKGVIKDAMRTKTRSVSRATKLTIGRLYTYVYDARDKKTLPYWDKFPLIIYLGSRPTKTGGVIFHGLNLHYIPPKARQEFLEELLPNATTKTINSNTKLRVNWGMVKGMRGSDLMIKAYLPSHVKSGFEEIKPTDWANAIYLPTHQFVSQGKRFSARKVWSKY